MENKVEKDFHAVKIDHILALSITFGLPFLVSFLFDLSGAFIPLLVYYGVCCVLLVKWRKGTLEYHKPKTWAPAIFVSVLIMQILTQICAYMLKISYNQDAMGILLTVLIWAPLNALMEQLLWLYLYDAFATRETKETEKSKKIVFIIIGFICYLAFIGLIHAIFWVKFLPAFGKKDPYNTLFFIFQFGVSLGYIPLYKKTKSMLPIAIIHVIADVVLVLAAGYSIGPYLFNF